MSQFKTITDNFLASPQIMPENIEQAKAEGVTLVINNRPDDEAPDQPAGALIRKAALDAGMDYKAIPVSSAGFSMPQVDAMAEALAGTTGKTLAFCRSGTRSTLLWALSQAKNGADPATIAEQAERGGYNVAPVRPTMDMLAGKSSD